MRTRQEIASNAVLAITGLVSESAAAVLPSRFGVWAGFVYTTLPLTMSLTASRYARRADRLRDSFSVYMSRLSLIMFNEYVRLNKAGGGQEPGHTVPGLLMQVTGV